MVDFRAHGKKPFDWFLKLYAYNTQRRLVDSTPVDRHGKFTETWQQVVKRAVLLARLNARRGEDWLELRVSHGIDGRIPIHIDNIWETLKPAVKESDCKPVDLSAAMNRLFQEQSKHIKTYRIFDAEASDLQHCGYSVSPFDGASEPLLDTEHGTDFVSKIVDAGGTCDSLIVEWLPAGSQGAIQKPLRTIIGGRTRSTRNQLTILAEAPAEAIDYVTDQLRHFGK